MGHGEENVGNGRAIAHRSISASSRARATAAAVDGEPIHAHQICTAQCLVYEGPRLAAARWSIIRLMSKDHRAAAPCLSADQGAIDEAARILARRRTRRLSDRDRLWLGRRRDLGRGGRAHLRGQRPAVFNPLIAHVESLAAAREQGVFADDAAQPRRGVLAWTADAGVAVGRGLSGRRLATAGLDSIALRVPDHDVAHAILMAFGKPVVAPSANRSGHVSPTAAAHVQADLGGRIDLIIDGGPTTVGVEFDDCLLS